MKFWIDYDVDIRRREVIEALARYFGEEALSYLDFYEKNWNLEKYSGGR